MTSFGATTATTITTTNNNSNRTLSDEDEPGTLAQGPLGLAATGAPSCARAFVCLARGNILSSGSVASVASPAAAEAI